MKDLPPLALSVRQPWAWAIIHGGKIIENRSLGAIKAGKMDCRRIAIHAAIGMTEKEYRWGLWRLDKHGVRCPHPTNLPRRAIIGSVDVVDIVTESDSEWFGGKAGLILQNPTPCEPVPAAGALGYFEWTTSGELEPSTPWMRRFDHANGDERTLPLFDDLAPVFHMQPKKPY